MNTETSSSKSTRKTTHNNEAPVKKDKKITLTAIKKIMGKPLSFDAFQNIMISDYTLAIKSRAMSLLSRREVLTGKAKFGITGEGKELPQIAAAKHFNKGDFRSGYYRDQTMMMALDIVNMEQHFAQLYANANSNDEPHSAGRQMNCHFATESIDTNGNWKNLNQQYNTAADISSTAGQMARSLGLGLASKKYRELEQTALQQTNFSNKGNEIIFVTIGDASTSEGVFWETINAAGVLQVPLVISVWDDGYGISVPTKYQTTKGSISAALAGFQSDEVGEGFDIYTVKGWDYPELLKTYRIATEKTRLTHKPALVHVQELTQPQGHSTSGSHERYKPKDRLAWEKDHDCIDKMRNWLLENKLIGSEALQALETSTQAEVKTAMQNAWKKHNAIFKTEAAQLTAIYDSLAGELNAADKIFLGDAKKSLLSTLHYTRKDIAKSARNTLLHLARVAVDKSRLTNWLKHYQEKNIALYGKHLYSESPNSPLKVKEVPPIYNNNNALKNGYQVINTFFDLAFKRNPTLLAFGEDVGYIGDVNQGFAGLQKKYGQSRIFDTGIRELTIVGQGIGLAMRGFRPIAEIQYLDYFIYGMQTIVDDLSTLRYRSAGKQMAPLIIRTRGHRLEGIWHSGSPIGMIINGMRGVHLAVPRNMTQAVGMYNTLLQGDDPAVVIECLNAYRLKEQMPDNIGSFTVPLGVPHVLTEGNGLTIVTYGACCRIVIEAADILQKKMGISCEVIDVQTLLPFDINHCIVASLQKTNRLLIVDEDVPGGGSAFILQQVLENQQGYRYLDAQPTTLTAKAHRPAYGSDGDYYSKPNVQDVIEKAYAIMHEADPIQYPEYL